MKFENAYMQMLKGKKVARPCHKGVWYYINGLDGKVYLHDNKTNTDASESDNLTLTLQSTIAEDWEIVNK
jgi:hypothetical protein